MRICSPERTSQGVSSLTFPFRSPSPAYRKVSLRYHPDKCNVGVVTEEDKVRCGAHSSL